MTTPDPLETYISRLRAALSGLTVSEREEIVEEIRAHILDRVSTSGLTVQETLDRLGPVEDLARDYSNGALVKRARGSFSPFLILRATLRWAMTGFHGIAVFIIALLGYTLGLGMMILAFIKPLFPDQTGLWVGPHQFGFGFRPENVQAHEVLGRWFMQVALLIGILSFIGTTILMRRLLRRFKYWRTAARQPRVPNMTPAGNAFTQTR